jgi:predicted PurR-regulated permease PerM
MLITKLVQTTDQPSAGNMSLGTFTGRLLVVLVIAALAAALWQLTDILVLLFGAVLLTIGLCAAARFVAGHTGIRRSIALAGVFLLGLCVIGAALWVFGSTIAAQLDDVIRAAPAGFKLFMAWMTDNPTADKCSTRCAGQTWWGPPAGPHRWSPPLPA